MTSPPVNITILVDNKARKGLASEHGLSLWIDTGSEHILLDTGQAAALARNSRTLGVDLATTDILVLSHGHYDHTGGIPHVARHAPAVEAYYHPGVFRNRYVIRDGRSKVIGMPEQAKSALDKLPSARLHPVQEPLMLTAAVGVTGPIPRLAAYEDTGGRFYFDPEGMEPDPIDDDLALWVRTASGVVICLGCAHSGVTNTLDYVVRLSQTTRIRAVIGGFHLLDASPDRIEQTVSALQSFAPDMLVPCHCTGERAVNSLLEAFGERVSLGKAGANYRF